jgi:hypothetical protein
VDKVHSQIGGSGSARSFKKVREREAVKVFVQSEGRKRFDVE